MLMDSIRYNANDKSFLKIFVDIYENIFFKKNFSITASLFYFLQFFFFIILFALNLINFIINYNLRSIHFYISLSIFFILVFSKAADQTYTILTFLMAYNLSLHSNLLSRKI